MADAPHPDPALVFRTVRANSHRPTTPWFDSTAFRPPVARHGHLDFGAPPAAAEEFLIASRLHPHDREVAHSVREYLDESFLPVVAAIDTEAVPEAVELPASERPGARLGDLIATRRSARAFGGGPVGFPQLATLVRACAGVTREPGDGVMPGRAVASGGALYPVELWVLALDVPGLDRGAYRYAPVRDVLAREGDAGVVAEFLREALLDLGEDSPVGRCAAIGVLVARPWRSMRKYGPRGMRLTLHEVGAMSQQFHLTAGALGLASTDWSSFYDVPANRALGLDGLRHLVLHTVLLGRPAT
ncbi:hypothetical protein SUDANB95_01987 [Actinosynnema sp. ALI-1.44]